MKDVFSIYERLLLNVHNEIQNDQDGITRNLAHIKELESRNIWLANRIQENIKAQRLLKEAQEK